MESEINSQNSLVTRNKCNPDTLCNCSPSRMEVKSEVTPESADRGYSIRWFPAYNFILFRTYSTMCRERNLNENVYVPTMPVS